MIFGIAWPDQTPLWQILVPAELNGQEIPVERHKQWDHEVGKIAGGLTILKGHWIGHWISSSGELFIEKMIPVNIRCDGDQIMKICDMTAKFYNQQAIMFHKVSDEVYIVHYDAEGNRK